MTTPTPPAPRTASTSPGTEPVHVVAGGDMVAVFSDRDSAVIHYTVMVGANLDAIMRTLSADQWAEVHALVRATAPEVVIVDHRAGDDR